MVIMVWVRSAYLLNDIPRYRTRSNFGTTITSRRVFVEYFAVWKTFLLTSVRNRHHPPSPLTELKLEGRKSRSSFRRVPFNSGIRNAPLNVITFPLIGFRNVTSWVQVMWIKKSVWTLKNYILLKKWLHYLLQLTILAIESRSRIGWVKVSINKSK